MMTIEEMKEKIEQINKELESLQLEGVDIVLVEKGNIRDALCGKDCFIQIIKGRFTL